MQKTSVGSDDEDEIEMALEELLDAQIASGDFSEDEGSDNSDSCSEEDDDDGTMEDFDEDEDSDNIVSDSSRKRKAADNLIENVRKFVKGVEQTGHSNNIVSENISSLKTDEVDDEVTKIPSHFSQINLNHSSKDEMERMFPLFANSSYSRMLEVSLQAGEMLYLPCGWFHEVSSGGMKDASKARHIAVNYWFHPPDGAAFQSPYTDSFWEDSWKRRRYLDKAS